MPAHPTQEQVQAEYETVWQALDARPIESLIDLPLMTDPELQAAMQVFSVLTGPRLLYRLPFVLLAGLPHGEDQPAVRDERRFRVTAMPIGVLCLRLSFTVTVRLIVSASLRATWSRSTASSQTRRTVYAGFGAVAVWTQPIGDRDRFHRTGIRAAIETGDPIFACYRFVDIYHVPSPAERSTRRGVARVGDGAGLRPQSQVRRRRGHYRKPATLHRDDAGPDRNLLHLQRCAVRRGGVRGSAHRGTGCPWWSVRIGSSN